MVRKNNRCLINKCNFFKYNVSKWSDSNKKKKKKTIWNNYNLEFVKNNNYSFIEFFKENFQVTVYK